MAEAAAILTGASAINKAMGQRREANALIDQSSFESRLAEMMAVDSTARGEQAAQRVGMQTRRMIGSQRAALAAQGIDVNSGSAADIQVDTATFSAMDEQIIRNNAAREAWGIRTNSLFSQMAAKRQATALRAESTDTLITGAVQTYDAWRKRPRGVKTTATGQSDVPSSMSARWGAPPPAGG